MACPALRSPRSRTSRVTSSTNSGTPPARSLTRRITSVDSVRRDASSAIMRRACDSPSSGEQRDDVMVRPQAPQGGRNSGRAVAKMRIGAARAPAVAQRLHEVNRRRVEPLQILKDENERLVAVARRSTTGPWQPTDSGKICSGERLGMRSGGTGMPFDHRAKQRSELPGVELDVSEEAISSSASRRSGRHLWSAEPDASPPEVASSPCSAATATNSIQPKSVVCRPVGPRNSSTSRDLPMPGSPTIRTN